MHQSHIMIDIETLGKTPGSVVLSIGAVKFDPFGTLPGDQLHFFFSLSESLNAGLRIDPDTLSWWLDQSSEAKVTLQKSIDMSGSGALDDFVSFDAWCRGVEFDAWGSDDEESEVVVWAHGPQFDVALLEAARSAFGYSSPFAWSYRNVRDTRTLYAAAEIVDSHQLLDAWPERTCVAHNALYDAVYQARCVQHAYSVLKSYAPPLPNA